MKKLIISVLSLGMMLNVSAQDMDNIVENPSFEQTEGRIKRSGAITAAVGWMSPTKAAADMFSGKVKEGFGTPNNNLGMEEAQDGTNYVGIRAFSYNDKEARNYVSSKLKVTMKKDQKYCVKFYVNLAEASKYAANNIGINFSKKQYNISEAKSIMTTTSVMHKDNPIFNGQFGWDEICGVYKAKGGEKFLTIGNFSANGATENQRLKKSKTFAGAAVVSAYYFIDNISVVAIDDESMCECEADAREPETQFIYEIAPMSSIEGMDPAVVASNTSIYFASGSSEISANSQKHLDVMLQMWLENKNSKIMITAHTDELEDENPNLKTLGDERLEAVKLFFMENGINYTKVLTENAKNTRKADNSGTDLAKAKNRRVTFQLIQ
jgi:outer membrane protein OmpA-like peptidoglycan-associated protein